MKVLKKRERRRRLLINPSFQLRFIGYMAAGVVFSLIAFYIADIYFFNTLIQHGKDFNLPPDHIYFQLISQQQGLMHNIFFVTRLIVFFVFSLSGLLLSHRIAGPLYNLKKYLVQSASNDNLSQLQFRKSDFFQEIPEAFNLYLKKRVKLQDNTFINENVNKSLNNEIKKAS